MEPRDTDAGDPALAATLGVDTVDTESPALSSSRRRRGRRETRSAGQHYGRYEVLERLGAGGMGVVYLARDPELDRKVALKLRRDPHNPGLTDRLAREARVMAQVNHPNVVTVFDVGVAEGTTYIAMEVVEGVSMRTWQHGLSAAEIVAAYIEAGRGLAAAHAVGIVHRDFKPDNVLIGADGRARVTDFGLAAPPPVDPAAHARHAPTEVHLTTSGSLLGTPAYMAPEQFELGDVDPRTDQFAFCAALYEALYGERPFAGATVEELGDAVCAGRVRPAPRRSRVSGGMRQILLRGLSVDPNARYATMERLLADLERDRARGWRRAAWISAAVCGVLALGLVADWAVRDRVAVRFTESFRATGVQIDRELRMLATQFESLSRVASHLPALKQVAAHHDQADFGLGTRESDAADLAEVHGILVSADWVRLGSSILAIADYKGRLLYTSAAPSVWGGDLSTLPVVQRALRDGKADAVTLVSYDDPALGAAGVLGGQARHGLAALFVRALAFGGATSVLYLQLVDGREMLDEIRFGEDTLLGLAAPNGVTIGDIPPGVGDGDKYQVQSRAMRGFDGAEIGQIVMARPIDGVLTLFPNARPIFTLAMLLAFATALGTAVRARQRG